MQHFIFFLQIFFSVFSAEVAAGFSAADLGT
jgi:hypothetical protein